MPQLHCYIQDSLAKKLQKKADQADLSVSKYLAVLIRRDVQNEWPDGYFELIGSWQGDPLKRPEQGAFENRNAISRL